MNDLLNDTTYAAPEVGPTEATTAVHSRRRKPAKKAKRRPTHYKVICISMYTRDIEQLDAKVAELKKRGFSKANKSQLIRIALRSLDIDGVSGEPEADLTTRVQMK